MIATGIGYGTLALRLVADLAKLYRTPETVPGQELRDVPAEQMFSDKPHAIWVPFLITGSWMLILAGIVWLAFVQPWLAAVVAVVFVAGFEWLRRRKKSPPGEAAT